MISPTMAVAAAGSIISERAAFARDARVARSAALVLDTIVFGFITLIVNSVYGVTEITSSSISASGTFMTTTTAVAWPWLTLLGMLYFAIPEAMFGASPGKYWMRLRVVRLDGRPLGLNEVIVRNLLKPIDFLPILYLLGGLLVLGTPGSQRIGDLAAGTTVMYQHRALEPGATRHASRTARRILVATLLTALLFTAGFDYFGRPPLVIDGMFKEHELLSRDLTSYSLGQPTWGLGTVRYPITGDTATAKCKGEIELTWAAFGWAGSSGGMVCET